MFYFTTSFNKYSNNDRYRNDGNAVHSAVIVMGDIWGTGCQNMQNLSDYSEKVGRPCKR